jgi:hypothetical protein
VVLDLIPFIYDRPGRVARILDREDNAKTVMLNQPFTMNPQTKRPDGAADAAAAAATAPQMGMGMPPQGPPMGMPGMPPAPPQRPQGKVLHYDLKKGRYGVVVSIGKSYKSRNEEGADEMGNLFQANPEPVPDFGRHLPEVPGLPRPSGSGRAREEDAAATAASQRRRP